MAHKLEQGQPLIKKIVWFLARPHLYGEFFRRTVNKVKVSAASDNHQIQNWCEQRAVSAEQAMQKIGLQRPEKSVQEQHQSIFERAKQAQEECPVVMGGAGHLDLMYQLCEHLQATRVIETGVAYGWSSLVFLISLTKRRGHLASTDLPYAIEGSEQYVGCVVPANMKESWTVYAGPDRAMLSRAIDQVGPIDVCHYDSDKSYAGRMWAYPKLWQALRKGGIFLSDDIGDNAAFHDFCIQIDREPTIVLVPQKSADKYLGMIVK